MFTVEADASDVGIGAVLMQNGKPLSYFSRKLGPRMRLAATYQKELFAIVEAVYKWRQYLLGRRFIIRTGHRSLKGLMQQKLERKEVLDGFRQEQGMIIFCDRYFIGVESKLKELLLSKFHNTSMTGHSGVKKITGGLAATFVGTIKGMGGCVNGLYYGSTDILDHCLPVLMRLRPCMDAFHPLIIPYPSGSTKVADVEELLIERDVLLRQLKKSLAQAKNQIVMQANKKHHKVEYKIKDMVLVKLQPYRQITLAKRCSNKLAKRYYETFEVLQRVGKVAYRLALPEARRLTRQVLVQWMGSSPQKATWEYLSEFQETYPSHHLEDKVISEGEKNVTLRRSKPAWQKDYAINVEQDVTNSTSFFSKMKMVGGGLDFERKNVNTNICCSTRWMLVVGRDVCVDLTWSSSLTQTAMVDFVPGRAVTEAAQRKRVKYEAKYRKRYRWKLRLLESKMLASKQIDFAINNNPENKLILLTRDKHIVWKSELQKVEFPAKAVFVSGLCLLNIGLGASNSIMARLEAQKAMCDSSERELHKKLQHKDELEKQTRPEWEQQARKRSRMDGILCNENDDNQEQHKAYETETQEEYETANAVENENNPQNMKVEEKGVTYAIRFPVDGDLVEEEEDEESRHQRGKGNIDKWLQLLMGEEEGMDQSTQLCDANGNKIDEIIRKMNLKYPQVEALNNKEPKIVEMKSLEEIVVKNHPYKITARRSSVSDPKLSTMKSLSLELDIPVSRVINVIFLFVLIYVNQYVTPNTKVLAAAYPIWPAAT
nr:hypothetical protein [Tanacetum cinerariifolium]